jgi:hypothetical protein
MCHGIGFEEVANVFALEGQNVCRRAQVKLLRVGQVKVALVQSRGRKASAKR